ASRELFRKPALATAMLRSAKAANAATVTDAVRIDAAFRTIILRTVGLDEPTARDLTLTRLLVQSWFGVLQSSLNGRVAIPDAENETRLACRLLHATCSNAAARAPARCAAASRGRPYPRRGLAQTYPARIRVRRAFTPFTAFL